MIGEDLPRLDSFSADEWFEVARDLIPGITRQEFDAMQARFKAVKLAHLAADATGSMQ